MQEELVNVKKKLKLGKHTCLIMRMEYPISYQVLQQDSYQEIIRLLSRDLNTLIKRSPHSYQEISTLLSRDLNTLIKRSQHSYQEISTLL